jgi:phosphohistidine swiveling domain-containing protein
VFSTDVIGTSGTRTGQLRARTPRASAGESLSTTTLGADDEVGVSVADLDRETLSHVAIQDILELTTGQPPADPGDWLEARAEEGRTRHTIAQAVELPPLVTDAQEFDAFERPAREPNFVTSERVRAPVAELDEHADTELDGRIVLIPQADPGYDWLFGYDIAGLVTMYGGTNSHMAIRAAEFGLPAAIGVGESLYEQITSATVLELDCEANTLERVR